MAICAQMHPNAACEMIPQNFDARGAGAWGRNAWQCMAMHGVHGNARGYIPHQSHAHCDQARFF